MKETKMTKDLNKIVKSQKRLIAELKRQNKALQREVKRLRMDPFAAHDAAVAALTERRAAEERLALEVELKETKN
jgi:peptidoglycan hydrolase CwlO-like protein